MVKLSNCISIEDQVLLRTLTKVKDVITELRAKYYNNAPTKNKKLIRQFYTYELDKNELISQGRSKLKDLCRNIIKNNILMKDVYDEKYTYNQLLIALPSRYKAVRDTQRQ